jgi:tetratricopeptide (TPR) repeat protein
MTVLGCSGYRCTRLISVSEIPGGNPTALADPEHWAIRFTICSDCRRYYCDRCASQARPAGTCRACGGLLVGDSALAELTGARPAPTCEAHVRGKALFDAGRREEALAAFDSAVRLRDGYPEAHLYRGMTLEQLGRPAEALTAYARVLQVDPQHVEALFRVGCVHLNAGRPERAIAAFDQVTRVDGRHLTAMLNKGAALMRQDRVREALETAEALIATAESDPEGFAPAIVARAYGMKGEALLRLGRPAEALEVLDLVLEAGHDYPALHLNRAAALRRLGRLEEAEIAERIGHRLSRPE